MKNRSPPGSAFFPSRQLPLKKISNYLYLFISACLRVGGGPQVGEVPRLAVVVYVYTFILKAAPRSGNTLCVIRILG